jgi:hypothetical protein
MLANVRQKLKRGRDRGVDPLGPGTRLDSAEISVMHCYFLLGRL